jgi:hypothetical protein
MEIRRSYPNRAGNCPPDVSRANLGGALGSRDPAHLRRWYAAMNAGKRAAPQCEAIANATGQRCQSCARRGQRFCFHHLRGKDAAAADIALINRNLAVLANPNLRGYSRRRAEYSMARIARAEIYRVWKIDPRAPAIDLLVLSAADEQRVADWLREQHAVDLNKNLPGSDKPPTARCRDRLRWAGWRVLARGDLVTPEFLAAARRRVVLALRDDAKFWRKLEKLDQEPGLE